MNIDNYFKSKILFSIPIYIRIQDDWHKDYKKKGKRFISEKKKFYEENEMAISKKKIISWEIQFNEYSTIWRYNEIIGFLEIKYHNNKLYSYLFKLDAKRFGINLSRKRYLFDNISFPEHQISSSFFNELDKYISLVKNHIKSKYPKFGKYYYDIESINNLMSIVK
jgi:hypothetical protein